MSTISKRARYSAAVQGRPLDLPLVISCCFEITGFISTRGFCSSILMELEDGREYGCDLCVGGCLGARGMLYTYSA